MTVYRGSTRIKTIYRGSTKIGTAYRGSVKVYGALYYCYYNSLYGYRYLSIDDIGVYLSYCYYSTSQGSHGKATSSSDLTVDTRYRPISSTESSMVVRDTIGGNEYTFTRDTSGDLYT